MARQKISIKQLAIDKDNSTILIVVAIATFLTIFSLVASKSLLSQSSYQAKVISQKKKAVKQLKTNASEVKKLQSTYDAFADQQQNILGGSSTGAGDRDGDNARIILDALPSKYDFPALATSLEKTFKQYKLEGITGTDDEIIQAAIAESANPQVVEIPFTLSVSSSAEGSGEMLRVFERSIRPIQIQKIDLKANGGEIKFNVTAKTYFQPSKTFNVTAEKVKK